MNKSLRALKSLKDGDQDRLNAALDGYGLSADKLAVLHSLVESNGPLALGDLDRLGYVKSNVSQLIDRLEAEGLVQCVPDEANHSPIRAAITDVGRQRYRVGQALSELAWDLG